MLVKPLIEIWDKTETTLLLRYDGFSPNSNNVNAILCSVSLGQTETTFSLGFADPDKIIDQSKVKIGCLVKVFAGRTSADTQLLFKGYIETRQNTVGGKGVLEYHLTGFGENASLNDLLITFKRAATSLNLDTGVPERTESNMRVFELIRDVMEDLDIRPDRDGLTPVSYLGLDLTGISNKIIETLSAVDLSLTEVSQVLNFFADLVGATWTIKDSKLIFDFPKIVHSGIVVKDIVETNDRGDSVGYFIGPWNYVDSVSKGEGFVNNAYVSTFVDQQAIATSLRNKGSSIMFDRWRAQQFTALDTRFSDLLIIASKIGDPLGANTSTTPIDKQETQWRGEIRVDNNNLPTGPLVAQFDIDVSSINVSKKTNVFINGLSSRFKANPSPNNKYWIIMFPIGTDLANTIRWHHNGDEETLNQNSAFANTTRSITADNKKGEFDSTKASWRLSSKGPTYTYSVFSRIRRIHQFSDPESIDEFRRKEASLNIDELDDSLSVVRYMQNILSFATKPLRVYNPNEVTIPIGKLYFPGEFITIIDSTVDNHTFSKNIMAEIDNVTYNWDSTNTHTALGILTCTIQPKTHYNWHNDKLKVADCLLT